MPLPRTPEKATCQPPTQVRVPLAATRRPVPSRAVRGAAVGCGAQGWGDSGMGSDIQGLLVEDTERYWTYPPHPPSLKGRGE